MECNEGTGDSWRLFVQLFQHIWETGEIHNQLLITIVVLIWKGGDNYRRIGLLEVA